MHEHRVAGPRRPYPVSASLVSLASLPQVSPGEAVREAERENSLPPYCLPDHWPGSGGLTAAPGTSRTAGIGQYRVVAATRYQRGCVLVDRCVGGSGPG